MTELAAIPWAHLAPFIVAGFLAHAVGSALGMGFGVISSSLLLMLGLPPVAASSAIRTVEGFAGGVSGLAHVVQGNVDWPLFARLVVPGIIGGMTGLWLLRIIHVDAARPVVLVYLAAIGAYLIWWAPRRPLAYRRMRFVGPLGLAGGILDAPSGGGWGPVVTASLLAQGMTPRMAIGTVNAAGFFVTVTVLSALIGTLGAASFTLAASGLLVGALAGAPLGAWITRRISPKPLMQLVGIALVAISLWGFLGLMFGPVPAFPRF
ncbi:sulfite exporter TauE/SafE family protein [Sphingomonas sp.]|uniref:sulfite exporter TauE/SafE family protein n=1 Tax=Sphingomonas sp. TaxID=28214 RepID=UPI0035B21AAE